MKKHNVIMKNAAGELVQTFIISPDSARTLKTRNVPGLVAITESSRVNHPSPAVMCAALAALNVDLTDFYTMAETLKNAPETDTDGADDTDGGKAE